MSEATPKAPVFNRENIKKALDEHFKALDEHFKKLKENRLPRDGQVFAVDQVFGTFADYWKGKMRWSRFEQSTRGADGRDGGEDIGSPSTEDELAERFDYLTTTGEVVDSLMDDGDDASLHVLYRAEVTRDLFTQMKNNFKDGLGTMVTGPQGIGKSHSLVNLVLRLQASGNYLVTFIPNCGAWYTQNELMDAICGSFGIDPSGPNGIGLLDRNLAASWFTEDNLDLIINAIITELGASKRKWVFCL
jgi:hypothetical protein